MLAYAAGDALGVPWEGSPPSEVHWEALETVPARGDWPQGATSDDTEQLLLVARYLAESGGQVDEREFLALLAQALPSMRGAGPTTTSAVRRFLATGEVRAAEGSTVGAAMRALPFGWATPVTAVEQRRDLTVRLSRVTHGAPAAIASAGVVAAMAAWAVEQHPMEVVVAAGLREAEHVAGLLATDPAMVHPLRRAATGNWSSSAEDRPLDAVTTVASVMHVLRTSPGLAAAMKQAVALGGDTDTTAAIVGGILGCQSHDVEGEIPWLSKVALPDTELIETVAARLYELRQSLYQ
jgi:ADP-ribosyl-[dinitrogen reductase] hydrolase